MVLLISIVECAVQFVGCGLADHVLNNEFLSCEKKTVVQVELLCSKCRQRVMKLIATLEGITSIVLDPSKNTVTVIGEADPVKIIKKVRKHSGCATVVSVGPAKEEKKEEKKDEKKDVPCTQKACQRCDVWYVVGQDYYSHCSIL